MSEPIHCIKGNCNIIVIPALFRGYYARCETCGKMAGTVLTTEAGALAEWNRWVEIGGFIQVAKSEAKETMRAVGRPAGRNRSEEIK